MKGLVKHPSSFLKVAELQLNIYSSGKERHTHTHPSSRYYIPSNHHASNERLQYVSYAWYVYTQATTPDYTPLTASTVVVSRDWWPDTLPRWSGPHPHQRASVVKHTPPLCTNERETQ